jgi:hypothetical protein
LQAGHLKWLPSRQNSPWKQSNRASTMQAAC